MLVPSRFFFPVKPRLSQDIGIGSGVEAFGSYDAYLSRRQQDHSAIAGLRSCRVQHRTTTPKPVWNPDVENPFDFRSDWQVVPDNDVFDNGFKAQWEQFLRHVVLDTPYKFTLFEGAKGVQLAELGIESWRSGSWVDVPALAL